jgi:hypothetical protein
MAAAEAAAEESRRRAERDAAGAKEVRRRGQELARRLRRLNAANHFAEWLFRDASGGSS